MQSEGRVMVVDDIPQNVKLLSAMLSHSGYEVIRAYSGEEALRMAKQSKPDIILLDIMMPGMDGYEVTETLKKDPETGLIPVVLVTALEGVDDKVKGLDAGADDFLTKPVNQIELTARMRSMIKLKKLQEEVTARKEALAGIASFEMEEKTAKKTVIIVEDDEKTAKQFSLILNSSGYEAVVAKDGNEALSVIGRRKPDIILLDILLPDITGIELLRRLKSYPSTEDIPVIICSVLSDLETKVKGIDTGADDYLIKPISPPELLARVRTALRKSGIQEKLKSDLNEIFRRSIKDSLTGLYNRQYFSTGIEKEIASSKRYNRKFSILMLDIDRFKVVNDTFGHLVGDGVLRELGVILRKNVRGSDIAARYGGEEFIIMLDGTPLKKAVNAAGKLRAQVEAHRFQDVGGGKITISIGVTEFHPEDMSMDDMVKRADEALYKAKREGRNGVKEG